MKRKTMRLFTKDCIVQALIKLMQQKEYDKITVTDITEKAGVSRMAYYRNYVSKDDILNDYMRNVGEEIHSSLTDISGEDKLFRYFVALFNQLGNHSEVGVAVLKCNLGELILHNIEENMFLTFGNPEMSDEDRYQIYLVAGAFCNVFIKWLKNGRVESPEKMADICCHPLPLAHQLH